MDNGQQSGLFLLNLPIRELPLSENFMLRSSLMGFFTILDIISADQRSLHTHPDYSELWYLEFIGFLKRKDLLHLLGRG